MPTLWRIVHAGLALVLAGNLVLILSWPLSRGGEVREGLDPVYAALCHRLPERSYELGGEPLPVCSRCLGVWLGLFLAAVLAAMGRLRVCRRTVRRALLLLGLMGVSWLLGRHGLPAEWHLERTVAGLLGGMGLYVLLWALLRLGAVSGWATLRKTHLWT